MKYEVLIKDCWIFALKYDATEFKLCTLNIYDRPEISQLYQQIETCRKAIELRAVMHSCIPKIHAARWPVVLRNPIRRFASYSGIFSLKVSVLYAHPPQAKVCSLILLSFLSF